jgi:hypothetical protein
MMQLSDYKTEGVKRFCLLFQIVVVVVVVVIIIIIIAVGFECICSITVLLPTCFTTVTPWGELFVTS